MHRIPIDRSFIHKISIIRLSGSRFVWSISSIRTKLLCTETATCGTRKRVRQHLVVMNLIVLGFNISRILLSIFAVAQIFSSTKTAWYLQLLEEFWL